MSGRKLGGAGCGLRRLGRSSLRIQVGDSHVTTHGAFRRSGCRRRHHRDCSRWMCGRERHGDQGAGRGHDRCAHDRGDGGSGGRGVRRRADHHRGRRQGRSRRERRDNVLLATFRFTPEGSTSEDVSIFKLLGNHSFRPELVDLKNLKKYGHVEELTGDVTAARSEVVESLYAFTAFPIPPADVTTIDMRVSDQAPLIEGLTLP